MHLSYSPQSATIYQFPLSIRDAVERARAEAKTIAELRTTRLTDAAVGAGWYHEAAIREADLTSTS